MNKRLIGWLMVGIGMAGVIAGAMAGQGVNLFWVIVVAFGSGLVGPWPWWSKKTPPAVSDSLCESKTETGSDESGA